MTLIVIAIIVSASGLSAVLTLNNDKNEPSSPAGEVIFLLFFLSFLYCLFYLILFFILSFFASVIGIETFFT
tara:strand:+ start:126 stop:341 length:216 start_codon:yes stop_codon:yes gene_type:complete